MYIIFHMIYNTIINMHIYTCYKRKYKRLKHSETGPETVCYGLNCVPQNLYVEDLIPNVMVFGGEAHGR